MDAEHEGALDRAGLARIALVAVAALVMWLRPCGASVPLAIAGVLATFAGGYPIFREALENALERRMTMELSMALAIAAALAIGETFTALVITLFVLVAEILEALTVARGRRSIRDLLDLLPQRVTVRDSEGAPRELAIDALAAGDRVLVAPGGSIPVDGIVVGGFSFVDQARITGESMPVEKGPGSGVFAGTINQSGALEVRVERLGRETAFGKIVEAIESAEQARAPVQRLADRFAAALVTFALGAAALTFALTRDVRSTIAVVIVAGACGIAAGTPLALLGAIGRCARAGAVVKGARFVEALAAVDTVVLDKTGTLTFGIPEVVALEPAPGISAGELLAAAALAEERSEHPLGKSIVRRAQEAGLPRREPDAFTYAPGLGVTAAAGGCEILAGNRALFAAHGIVPAGDGSRDDGATEVFVARDGRALGTIAIRDELRAQARGAIDALRALRVRTILLTGDAAPVATAVARRLEVDEVEAELLPDGKLARVDALVASGRRVAMIGDGINDAPALARADVGIAMGSGTDVARETADIVLIGNDLLTFVETVRIARRARRIIVENFAGTVAVDAVGIVLAGFGFLPPLLAAFVHVASELTFILNATRMLPPPRLRSRGLLAPDDDARDAGGDPSGAAGSGARPQARPARLPR